MKVTELMIRGVFVLEPDYYEDSRGYYCETYSSRTLAEHGIDVVFVQDNHFMSKRAGTVRGIHFQKDPYAQSKLVRCIRGELMSIAVDLRYGSPTFKKWIGEVLSESNRKQLYIPKGFGHCCMSLVDMTEGQYKVDTWYEPRFEGRIRWDDPEIGIQWPNIAAIVSEKDRTAPYFRDADMGFTMT